jgi:hypothetical protein
MRAGALGQEEICVSLSRQVLHSSYIAVPYIRARKSCCNDTPWTVRICFEFIFSSEDPMRRPIFILKVSVLCLLFLYGRQIVEGQTVGASVNEASLSAVAVVLAGDEEGNVSKLASALVVEPNGVLLVPYHVVRDAKQLQVRLKSGEIFDDVSLLNYDARRDVAAIKIQTSGLSTMSPAESDDNENQDGFVVTHRPEELWSSTKATYGTSRMADTVPGAGEGFRVVEVGAAIAAHTDGGILFRRDGRPFALITTDFATPTNQTFAVPVASVTGLATKGQTRSFGNGVALKLPTTAALNAAKNPSKDPKDLLLISKTVFVETNTTFFKEQQLIAELNKRKAPKDWGWTFITGSWDARNKADLVIELDHQILTFNFSYAIRHRRSSVMIAAGTVTIADGASGAPKMVDKIIKDLYKVRGETPTKK